MQSCNDVSKPFARAMLPTRLLSPAVTVAVDCRYGVNEDGNSVCTFVHGFEPYIYIESPTRDFGPDECRSLQHHVNVRSAARLCSAEAMLCACFARTEAPHLESICSMLQLALRPAG